MRAADPAETRRTLLVAGLALAFAAASARPFAGSWNDGSRLAAVESLVDRGTFAIDDSIFVRVPADRPPYPASEPDLVRRGTQDKLLIGGRFYSDKPPVPAVAMAGVYALLKKTAGLSASHQPGLFCFLMTLLGSGIAYSVAVTAIFRLAGVAGLPPPTRFALTGSLALSTTALPYVRHVNSHELLLGVTALLVLSLARAGEAPGRARFLGIGTLAGASYTLDLGIGPVVLAATLGFLLLRRGAGPPSLRAGALAFLAALPWVILHHALNFAVGGTVRPANSVLEYLAWPGSPFDAMNATGSYHHPSPAHLATYGLALLFGKRGFVGHDLPVFLGLVALAALARRPGPHRPQALFSAAVVGGGWLVYAVSSTNYSGACCSIRWFVPFLAPLYWALAVFLKEHPEAFPDFLALSLWGAVLGALMWWKGPWTPRAIPFFWPIQAAALGSWALVSWQRRRLADGA